MTKTDAPIPVHVAGIVGLLLAGAAASFAFAGVAGWRHFVSGRRASETAIAAVRQDLADAAVSIDRKLAAIVPVAERLAAAAETNGTDARFDATLRATLNSDHMLAGAGVAYQRFGRDAATRLYAPFVMEQADGGVASVRVDASYDYTDFRYTWFRDPIFDGKRWSDPSSIQPGNALLVSYGVPFYHPNVNHDNEAPRGVAVVAVGLPTITKEIDALNLHNSGYAFLFTHDGRLLSHPRRDLVQAGGTIFDVAWTASDTALHSVAIHGIKGESGFIGARDETTGQATWIAYHQIPSTGWTLAAVLFQQDFEIDANQARHDLFELAGGVLLGVLLIALAGGPYLLNKEARHLWQASASVSTALLLAVGVLWLIVDRYPSQDSGDRVRVYDAASAEQYLDSFDENRTRRSPEPEARIPTGVFVKSIEFESSTDLTVTGYIWQRYSNSLPADLEKKVILVEAEEPKIQEMYHRTVGNDEIIGWYFTAKLRQQFSYARYPFDRQDVWVRLRPADLTHDVALVPDFESYELANPAVRPGVMPDLVLPGWSVTGSYFEYRPEHYNTTFGIDARTDVPEFYFSVGLRRQVLGPFISNLLPLAVTGAMLFGILLLSTTHERRFELFGFKAIDVVLGCAALFFVASFQHVALRQALASPSVFYFEYFYFALYLAILAVSLNAILFASQIGVRFVAFRDNLLPKLIFWPAYLAAVFAMTFYVML